MQSTAIPVYTVLISVTNSLQTNTIIGIQLGMQGLPAMKLLNNCHKVKPVQQNEARITQKPKERIRF